MKKLIGRFALIAIILVSQISFIGIAAAANMNPLDEVSDALAQLNADIATAQSARNGIVISGDGSDVDPSMQWVTPAADADINNAIYSAQVVAATAGVTASDLNNASSTLWSAINVYNNSKQYGNYAPEYITHILLQYDTPDENGVRHYLGEDSDPAYKTLHINEKFKEVPINGFYLTNRSAGVAYETDGSAGLGSVGLVWTSSDVAIATVSPYGVVTPHANGQVTITAQVNPDTDADKYQNDPPFKEVTIVFDGQEGEYVTSVDILDENGNYAGGRTGNIMVFDKTGVFHQFYVEVTWVDSDGIVIRTENTFLGDTVNSTVKWSVGGAGIYGTVNEDTGRFKTGQYSGNTYVTCTVAGGIGGKSISDDAQIQVNTGESPVLTASSLTLKVEYENYPGEIVQEHTYSVGELASRLSKTGPYLYTLSTKTGYETIYAEGYLLKDVFELEGVKFEEVLQFKVVSSDGHYSNIPISIDFLYNQGPRYGFKNWDVGSRVGAQVVPPILATSDYSWKNSTDVDPTKLNANYRFRLVYGSLWSMLGSPAELSVKGINTLTIVLRGSPPIENNPDGKDTTIGGGSGLGGNGSGTGPGGDGAGIGSGNSDGSDLASSGGDGGEGEGDDGHNAQGEGHGWRVWEMMSNAQSQVEVLELNNPLTPFTIPFAAASVLTGAGATYYGFKRRIA